MGRHRRECLAICRDAGLTVFGIDHGRHDKYQTDRGILVMPCSPSDRRWIKNASAQARRLARGI